MKKNEVTKVTEPKTDILADILNVSETIKKGASNRSSYNYLKVAENIFTLNKIMSLNLSDADCEKIKNNKAEFSSEKTKVQYANEQMYAKVKKSVRKFIQNFQDKNTPYNLTQQAYIKGLCM